jgi:hypothetical protein
MSRHFLPYTTRSISGIAAIMTRSPSMIYNFV